MPGDYLGMLSDVFGDQLHAGFLACASCRRGGWDMLQKAVDARMKDTIDISAYTLLDTSTWKTLSGVVGEFSCVHCFGRYARRLHLVRQIYRDDLVQHFERTARMYKFPLKFV